MLAYWKLSGEFNQYPLPDDSNIPMKFITAAKQKQYEEEIECIHLRDPDVKAEISRCSDYLLSAKEETEHEINEQLQIHQLLSTHHSILWHLLLQENLF